MLGKALSPLCFVSFYLSSSLDETSTSMKAPPTTPPYPSHSSFRWSFIYPLIVLGTTIARSREFTGQTMSIEKEGSGGLVSVLRFTSTHFRTNRNLAIRTLHSISLASIHLFCSIIHQLLSYNSLSLAFSFVLRWNRTTEGFQGQCPLLFPLKQAKKDLQSFALTS
ncbi:hypothetical protein DAI22_12g149901 [Oryza sativa Japonica Group]|uniref:Mitochondrial DNA orf165 n=1 Tax=Oryza sativa subsp. japonica TaxID=39947 RepID=Q67TM8_ORYSJ|nr:hypothetical protein DAI22_12g149901 [Oryza sativa Japonica Group]BAD38493.1 mitochondrial DNA orf165 [Oryza sativa Japonica Group]